MQKTVKEDWRDPQKYEMTERAIKRFTKKMSLVSKWTKEMRIGTYVYRDRK